MPSLNNAVQLQVEKKTVWLLCAVAANALEFFVPRLPFFPWLKPGFANVITILWIVEFGAIDALVYSLLRVWIVGFYFGFSFLTMTLALSGGVLSTAAMGLAWKLFGKNGLLGSTGLGILGALFHNLGQLSAVYLLLSSNPRIAYQLPVMLAASLVFGGITGLLAPMAGRVLSAAQPAPSHAPMAAIIPLAASRRDTLFSFLVLAGCAALVFVTSMPALCAGALGATLASQAASKGPLTALGRPIARFWVLFAYIACVNLFFSYGTRIDYLPFLTRDGLRLTAEQWLRLWTWLQASAILTYFGFHAVLFQTLRRLFRGHHQTLAAGMLALEYFPEIADAGRMWVREALVRLWKAPTKIRRLEKPGWTQAVAQALYKLVVSRIDARNADTPAS